MRSSTHYLKDDELEDGRCNEDGNLDHLVMRSLISSLDH